jgi:hypothetical protein
MQTYFEVRKLQIRIFLCCFNPLIASPHIVHLKTFLTKLGFLTAIFPIVKILIRELLAYICKEKNNVFSGLLKFEVRK